MLDLARRESEQGRHSLMRLGSAGGRLAVS